MPSVIVNGVPVEIDEYGMPVAPSAGGDAFQVNPFIAGSQSPTVAPPAAQDPAAAPAAPAPVTNEAPAPAAPIAASSPVQTTVKEGTKVATSQTSMSDERLAKNRQGYREVFKGEGAIAAQEQERAAQQAAPYRAAEAAGEAAVGQEAEAQAKKFDAQAEGHKALADLNNRFALAYQEAQNVAAATAQTYRAQTEQALVEYRAADVNPAQLWGNMTGGERFGTAITAFVTDFLGAKGIRTQAMDIFNQAVERSINAQVENIRKKGQVAEHFKSLWDMAMREGQSELEAKQMIHAYYLAGAEKEVLAAVSRFDSDIARAQGAKQVAALRADLATRLQDIQDKAYARTQQRLSMKLDQEYRAQQLAIQRSGLAIQREQLAEQKKARQAAALDKAATELDEKIILDDSGNPIKKARTTKDAEDIRIRQAGARNIAQSIAQVRDLVKEAGEVYGGWGKAMADSAFEQRAMAARDRLLTDYGKMKSGATFTASEIERYARGIPLDTWTTEPPTDAIYSDLANDGIREMQEQIDYRTSDFNETDKQLLSSGRVLGSNPEAYKFSDDLKAENDALARGSGAKETAVDDALEKVTAPDAREFTTDKDALQDWQAAGFKAVAGADKTDAGSLGQAAKLSAPKFVEGLKELADVAMASKTSPYERDRAITALWNAAQSGDIRGAHGEGFQEVAGMAQYYLQQVIDYSKTREDVPDVSLPTDNSEPSETAGGSY